MLLENHPLATLTSDNGFRLHDVGNVAFTGTLAGYVAPAVNLSPGHPKFVPLREMIPFTKGRAEDWKLVEHVTKAKARNWPTFKPFEFNGQSIAICGGGPSLGYTLHELRALQKKGTKVMAINRTHDFLLDLPKTHGIPWIKPWAGILLESIPHAAGYMRPTSGVRYYVGSQCHPDTFDKFEKSEHYIWHAESRPEMVACLTEQERKHMVPANGSTCGLRAAIFAYMMGFTDIHLFGFDSCYSEYDIKNGVRGSDGQPRLHSYHKPEAIHDVREAVIKGWDDGIDRTYWGNANMLAQGDEFLRYVLWRDERIKAGGMDKHNLIVHGFGLIPDIARATGLHADNFTPERKAA